MTTLFETQRTIVRNWIPEKDAVQAFEIYGDREVMRFIGDGKTAASIEEVRDRLQERIDSFQKLNNGMGFWAVVSKTDEQILGTILLKQLPDNDGIPTEDIEIGWHFRRIYWGHSYATEAALGIVAYGLNILKLPVLYAVTKPENERSIRVMQRLGMKPRGRISKYYGVEVLLFELTPYA
jgi:[ribosomal protein S5]-alanine N-acetyltransferase